MKNINNDFLWIQKHPDLIYCDSGATSLKPKPVLDAIYDYYVNYGTNTHNLDSPISYQTQIRVDKARKNIANFFDANENEIIFTSGATESLNLIANGLTDFFNEGDEIITTYGEHSSNLIPWQVLENNCNIKIVYAGKKGSDPELDDFLNAITDKTKLVTFASGYNLTGKQFDHTKIIKAIKSKNPNILVCVDMTQSVQHRPFLCHECDCDFAVCSAHKIFGPTGIGMAYIKKSLQPIVKPIKYGGGMNFSVDLHKFSLMESIAKYEGGTPNIAGIFGFDAAISYLRNIGYDTINQHEKELLEYAIKKFKELKGVELFNTSFDVPILTFGIKNVFAQDLAAYLGQNNIIVRGGVACAKLIPNIIGSANTVRASLYIYNDKSDIDKLVLALQKYKKGDELDGII